MTPEEVLDLYRKSGALLEGHFLLSSGLHSDRYLQSALVLQSPRMAERLGAALAGRFREMSPESVIAPALGGILVAHEVARALGVRALFAERAEGKFMLRRGFSIQAGERVLVVEDVVTTGVSTRETMEVVRSSGGLVIAAGALVDRSNGAADLGVSFQALLTLNVPTYPPEHCPLCRKGTPVVKPGSRMQGSQESG